MITSSLVIPTRNRQDELLRLLDNLVQCIMLPNEVIVVDSSDDSFVLPESIFNKLKRQTNFRYIHTHIRGASAQRNVGVRVAIGELIFFLDDDVLVPPHYFAHMCQIFVRNTYFGGGMCAVAHPNTQWSFNRLLRVIFFMQREGGDGRFTLSGMPKHPYGSKSFKEVNMLNGLAVYRRELLLKEAWNEDLGTYPYMEDIDLSIRISKHARLFYEPALEIIHTPSTQNREAVIVNRSRYIHNYSLLFFKHFYLQAKWKSICYSWTIVGLFVEALLARNTHYLKGYVSGLIRFWFITRYNRPKTS